MRRTALPLLLASSAVLLTGCFKANVGLEVNADDTVSGSFVMALDKDFQESLGAMGEGADDMGLGDMGLNEDDVARFGGSAKVEAYEDDGYVGQKITFDGVPLTEVGKALSDNGSSGDTFDLVHLDDQYRFTAEIDMGEVTGGAADSGEGLDEMAEMMLKDAEMTLAVTFPGKVIESNGQVDGRTVTWDLLDYETTATLTAVAQEASAPAAAVEKVADATGMPGGALVVGAGVLGAAVVGAGLVARSNRRNA